MLVKLIRVEDNKDVYISPSWVEMLSTSKGPDMCKVWLADAALKPFEVFGTLDEVAAKLNLGAAAP